MNPSNSSQLSVVDVGTPQPWYKTRYPDCDFFCLGLGTVPKMRESRAQLEALVLQESNNSPQILYRYVSFNINNFLLLLLYTNSPSISMILFSRILLVDRGWITFPHYFMGQNTSQIRSKQEKVCWFRNLPTAKVLPQLFASQKSCWIVIIEL